MKKLIPAISLLLVTCVLVVSSTYAWFSMNTSVTANGMSVTAKTDGGLAIAAYTASPDGSTAVAPAATAFASTAAAVFHSDATVSPVSFNGEKWYSAKAKDANSYEAESGSYAAIAASGLDDYRLISKFQIKSMDTNSDTTPVDLYVTSITVTGSKNSTALNGSLRVVINIGGTYYYFAPLYTSVTGGNLYYYNGTARTAKAVGTAIYINDTTLANGVKIMNSTLKTTPQDVDVYAYYEGEDDNCKSINAANIDTLSISINFATEVSK